MRGVRYVCVYSFGGSFGFVVKLVGLWGIILGKRDIFGVDGPRAEDLKKESKEQWMEANVV